MNLSQREKLLGGGVALVILVVVGGYAWDSIRKGLDKKLDTITSLQEQKDEQSLKLTNGAISKARLNRLAAISLPSKEENARAEYMKWLIETADEVGLIDPQPRNLGDTIEKDVFQSFKFQLTGIGNIETATRLLYAFQSKDYLHRILRYDLRPINNQNMPGRMNISLDCEVLALKNAKPDQPPSPTYSHRLTKSLDEYKEAILGRNIFAPTNHPPRLDSRRTVEATKGIRLDYTVEAQEVDPGQSVSYALEGDYPKGMKIDPETGKINWTPTELNDYKVSVRATDSGIPNKSSLITLSVKVSEPKTPPPPPPQFDIASQAFVSALVADAKGPEAWVRSKTEGKTLYLRKGDQLKLGDVVGKVIDVGVNYLELETDGKRWLVGLDESLADAYKRSMTE